MYRILLLTLIALVACAQPQTPKANLGGTLKLAFAETPAAVPSRLIVGFKPTPSLQSMGVLNLNGLTLRPLREIGEDTFLYEVPSSQLAQATQALLRDPSVTYAHPDYLLRPARVPTDPRYPEQWSLPTLNVPQVWDVETGATNPVTVAVVDTGILWKAGDPSKTHPDLVTQVLPGYDFITDSQTAADGGGRDPDPYDDGNVGSAADRSDYHGSHVAGIVAASANDGGMAGVSWGAKLLPVRVLGSGGGALSDIIDGIAWAAGLEVTGVPTNPNPAQIINLSLGGRFRCADAPALQAVLDRVRLEKGAIVVAAAGNQADNAAFYSPGSCTGVITVGATDSQNRRPGYSNYGSRIDVVAPGGEASGGILSLSRNDSTAQMGYQTLAGTSMAAPHVAGVLALLKSAKPDLSFNTALDLLKRSARPLSASACDNGAGGNLQASDCGSGLVDALAVYQLLTGTGGGGGNPNPNPIPPSFTLYPQPSSLVMQAGQTANATIAVLLTGGFNAAVSLELLSPPAGINGTLRPVVSGRSTLELTLAPNLTPGNYALRIRGTSGSLVRDAGLVVVVREQDSPPPQPTIQGAQVTACFWDPKLEGCNDLKSAVFKTDQDGSQVEFGFKNLELGDYYLLAWKDVDGDGKLSDPDYVGSYVRNGEQSALTLGPGGIAGVTVRLDLQQEVARYSVEQRKVLEAAVQFMQSKK